METLDKSKPYGTITGDHPACFTQDGKEFNAKGDLIKPKVKRRAKPKAKPKLEPVVIKTDGQINL